MHKELSTTSFDSSFFHTNIHPYDTAGVTRLIKFLWITIYYNETYETYNFSNSAITPFYISIKIYIQEKKKYLFSSQILHDLESLNALRIKISSLNNCIRYI